MLPLVNQLQLRFPSNAVETWSQLQEGSKLFMRGTLQNKGDIYVTAAQTLGWINISIKHADTGTIIANPDSERWQCLIDTISLETAGGITAQENNLQAVSSWVTPVQNDAEHPRQQALCREHTNGHAFKEQSASETAEGDTLGSEKQPGIDLPQLRSKTSSFHCFVCGFLVRRRNRGYFKKHLKYQHQVELEEYRAALAEEDDSNAKAALLELRKKSAVNDAAPEDVSDVLVSSGVACPDGDISAGSTAELSGEGHPVTQVTPIFGTNAPERASEFTRDASAPSSTLGMTSPPHCDVTKRADDDSEESASHHGVMIQGNVAGDKVTDSRFVDTGGENSSPPRVNPEDEGLNTGRYATRLTTKKNKSAAKSSSHGRLTKRGRGNIKESAEIPMNKKRKLKKNNRLSVEPRDNTALPTETTNSAVDEPNRDDTPIRAGGDIDSSRVSQPDAPTTPMGGNRRESKKISCPGCEKVFGDIQTLVKHVRKAHDRDKNFQSLLVTVDEARHSLAQTTIAADLLTRCPYCNVERAGRHVLSHMRLCHSNRADLKVTLARLDDDLELRLRLSRRTREKEDQVKRMENGYLWPCRFCGKDFLHRPSRARHERSCRRNPDSVQTYRCGICERTFATMAEKQNHLETHINDSFLCDICGKKYKTPSGLLVHRRTEHHVVVKREITYFPCAVCGKQFYNKYMWKEHAGTHSDDKSFCCDICGRQFKRRRAVAQHKATCHDSLYAFHCDKCGHGLTTLRYLRKHQCGRVRRVHPGEVLPEPPTQLDAQVTTTTQPEVKTPGVSGEDPARNVAPPGIVAAPPGIVAAPPGIVAPSEIIAAPPAAPPIRGEMVAAPPGIIAAPPGIIAAPPGIIAAPPGIIAAPPVNVAARSTSAEVHQAIDASHVAGGPSEGFIADCAPHVALQTSIAVVAYTQSDSVPPGGQTAGQIIVSTAHPGLEPFTSVDQYYAVVPQHHAIVAQAHSADETIAGTLPSGHTAGPQMQQELLSLVNIEHLKRHGDQMPETQTAHQVYLESFEYGASVSADVKFK